MRIGWMGVAAGLAMVAAGSATAGTGWSTIGSAKFDGGAGTATAQLRWQAAFREMMVCAEGGAVKLGEATLRFRDGSVRVMKLRSRLNDGACTAPLSVGKGRDAASMDLAYEAAATAGGAGKLMLAAR